MKIALRRSCAAAALLFTAAVFWSSHRTWDGDLGPRAGFGNLLHFIVYGAIAALWAIALDVPGRRSPAERARAGAAAAGMAVGSGFLDEIHQFHVVGRSCSTIDLAIDALGASFAVLLLLHAARRRLRDPARLAALALLALLGVWLALRGGVVMPVVDRALERLLQIL